MDASIRELKAKLSGVIRRVEAGEFVTVHVRQRAVARIVPIAARTKPADLARIPGIAWRGGKPAGMPHGERLPRGVSLSARVAEDRR